MTVRRFSLIAVMVVIVAACSTTGGIIGGLIPAPKFLKGEIKNNVYYAPNKLLSVAVPFAKGTYEYTYMQVTEKFEATGGFVVLGPAAFDQGRYRVDLFTRKDGLDTIDVFTADAPIFMHNEEEMMQKDGRAPLENLAKDEDTINGHPTHHERVRQHAPAGVLSNQPEVLTYDFFVMQFGSKVAVAMVMRPEKSVADPPAISVASFVQSIQVP